MVESEKTKELKKIYEVDYSKYEHIKMEKKANGVAVAALNQYLRFFAVTCFHYSWAFQTASRRLPDAVEASVALREKRPPKFY